MEFLKISFRKIKILLRYKLSELIEFLNLKLTNIISEVK